MVGGLDPRYEKWVGGLLSAVGHMLKAGMVVGAVCFRPDMQSGGRGAA